MTWKGKIAVVTGASSGIGAVTAHTLAAAGMRVVLVARRLDRLLGLKNEIESSRGQADVIAADLSNEHDRLQVFTRVTSITREVDVLINNAGFGWYGYYADMPWETAHEMIQVNIAAAAHLTSLFLPGMRERNTGHIINIGSISGSIPSQGVALYSASKAFLDAFTTALHRETRKSHVHISIVRAGPVKTEFCSTAAERESGRHLPTESIGVPAETVARQIWKLLLRPRRVVYIPAILRLTPWVELSFGWLEDLIGALLLKHKPKGTA
jgi:hypothetical protein